MQPTPSKERQDLSVVAVSLDWIDSPISTADEEALVLCKGWGALMGGLLGFQQCACLVVTNLAAAG